MAPTYLFLGGLCRVAEDGEPGCVNGLLLLISRLFLLLFASFPLGRWLSLAAFCFLGEKNIINQCCGSGIRCLFDPRIRDPGWAENQDPDPG